MSGRGCAPARADVLDELRDGIFAAVETRLTAGLPAETAADEAIAEFGPAGVVAAALQAELSAARARGIARRMFAAGPVLGRSGSPRWRHRW